MKFHAIRRPPRRPPKGTEGRKEGAGGSESLRCGDRGPERTYAAYGFGLMALKSVWTRGWIGGSTVVVERSTNEARCGATRSNVMKGVRLAFFNAGVVVIRSISGSASP